MTTIDRRFGVAEGVAMKAPVRLATTGSITLSGLQTIDGTLCAAGDRVLVRAQSTSTENGIYVVAAGAWTRDKDFDGALDAVKGTRIFVNEGTLYGGADFRVSSDDPITIGSSAITFDLVAFSSLDTIDQLVSDLLAGVQAAAPTVTYPVETFGDSITAGIDPTDEPYADMWPALLGGLIDGTVTNNAISGTKYASGTNNIKSVFLARGDAAIAAMIAFIEGGPNDYGAAPTTFQADCLAAIADIVSALTAQGNNRYLIEGSQPTGYPASAYAVACELLAREIQRLYPGHFFDQRVILLRGGSTSGDDAIDREAGHIPRSQLYDTLHPALVAQPAWARAALGPVSAFAGRAPWLPFEQTIFLDGPAAAAARLSGGSIGRVYALGTVDSYALLSGNERGYLAIDSAGNLSHTNIPLDVSVISATAQASNGALTGQGVVKLLIGRGDYTAGVVQMTAGSQLALNDGFGSVDYGANRVVSEKGLCDDSQFFSIHFGFGGGTDGVEEFIAAFGPVRVTKLASNTISVYVYNVARDTVIAEYRIGSGTATEAAGLRRYFFSLDGTDGTAVGYVDDTSSLTTITPLTPTVTFDFSNGQVVIGAGDANGAAPLNGALLEAIWIIAGATNWNDTARHAFFDPDTGEAKDLGSDGTANSALSAPVGWWGGNSANWTRGNNRGTGAATVMVQRGGSIADVPSQITNLGDMLASDYVGSDAGGTVWKAQTVASGATGVTASGGDNSTKLATTGFVHGELAAKAPIDAPVFTTSVTLPGDPSTSLQAATKQYVDGIAANLGKRARVRAATTADVTIATALNNGDTIDGVTLATGDLVLVKSQSTTAQNGIYVVGASPSRASEFDTYDEHPGSLIAVEEGSTNGDTIWLCTSNVGGTLNTTAIAFTQMVIAGELKAANNLSDLANAGTARTNLGLGDSATKNVGTTAGTVSAGDDSRITGAAQKSSNLSDLASAATARTNLGLFQMWSFGGLYLLAAGVTHYFGNGSDGPDVGPQGRVMTRAGTVSQLRVHVEGYPDTGNNVVYTVMQNGVATALTCTLADQNFNASDLTHSFTVAAGDLICVRAVASGGATSVPSHAISMEFTW